MDTIEAIKTRRSIRSFDTEKEITDEQLEKIIKAGMQAPSAFNQQPWHFMIIRDKDILAKMSEVSQYFFMIQKASVAIIVYTDTEKHIMTNFWPQDCAACTQNMLLTIRDMDLGWVRCGIHWNKENEDKLKEIIETPNTVEPFCIIPIWVPKKEQEFRDNFDETKIHHGKW